MGATKDHGYDRVCAQYRKRSQLLSANVFVAITDDNGDPQLGMVIEVIENGEGDEWHIIDGMGDDYYVPADMVPVIDHERLEDLYSTAVKFPHDPDARP